ncbi:MAG TPA: hypothetical protein DCG33_01765 [Prevotellaceae bacterium]|nr:hypothetical protein [Prevotellaceae bacterium]
MDNFVFNPVHGFKDATAYPNPNSETETREQLFSLHEQTRDFINANLVDAVTSDTVVKIKANETGFSYSTDGTNYTVIEGSSSGQGDMYTSVYDTDADGIVDNAERVNGHTVEKDVPADAKFTDTVYDDTTIDNRLSTVEEHLGAYRPLLDRHNAKDPNTTATININGLTELVFLFRGKTTSTFQHIFILPVEMIRYIVENDDYIFAGTVRGSSDGNYVRYYLRFSFNAPTLGIIFNAWVNGSGYTAGVVSVFGR